MLHTGVATSVQSPQHATGRQVKRKLSVNRPACARRKSGTKGSLGIPDMFQPVEGLTEHAMFVELLPTCTKAAEWVGMQWHGKGSC